MLVVVLPTYLLLSSQRRRMQDNNRHVGGTTTGMWAGRIYAILICALRMYISMGDLHVSMGDLHISIAYRRPAYTPVVVLHTTTWAGQQQICGRDNNRHVGKTTTTLLCHNI